MSTRLVVFLASLGVLVPVLLTAGRVLWGLHYTPTAPDVILLDLIVLAIGTVVLTGLVAQHAHEAFRRPLQDLEAHIGRLAEGRLDSRLAPRGMTELRRLAEASNLLAANAERSLHHRTHGARSKALGTVLAGVAHEVQNPLTQMRLNIRMMQASSVGQPQVRDSLERIDQGIDRLANVVASLKTANAAPGEHEVSRLIDAAVIAAQDALYHHAATVRCATTRSLECDPREVVLALVALLQNAGEAADRTVEVSARDDRDDVVIEIEDDGPGVPEALRGTVAAAFVTSKQGHVGLGLAHVAEVATALGGSFAFKDTATGACAILRLPAASVA